MHVLRTLPGRLSFAAYLVAIVMIGVGLVRPTSAVADQMGIEDNGPSGDYGFGSSNCEGNKSDPVGVVFRGKKAGPSNVSAYVTDEAEWHWTENDGPQGLLVHQADGSYKCRATDASNAQHTDRLPSSRFHVRLWYVPGSAGGGEVKTVGTPHHEDWVTHDPTGLGDHCTGIISILGEGPGNHAVDEGGIHQGKDSGFDQGRHELRKAFEPHHAVETEFWGNTAEFEQCDEDMAGSDGWGTIISVNRAMHPDARAATSVLWTAARLNGELATEELMTEYWFSYGLNSSEGASGYPYKTPVRSVSGTADINVGEALSGLTPNSTYYTRMFARNQDGEVEEGPEIQFKTCAPGSDEDATAVNPLLDCKIGTLHNFYRTPSGGLGHDWSEPGNPVWGVETLGGSIAAGTQPHAIFDPKGTLHVFYRTPSGGLGHDWSEPGNPVWGVETLGGSLASSAEPHAVYTVAGELNVFYRTPSGGLGHNWSEPGNPVWGVETLGGSLASSAEPHAVVMGNNVVHVFYRTPSGGLGHDWHEPWNPVWGVETLGGSVSYEPHAVAMPNNVVHVFYRTSSGGLGHDWHEPWNPVWGVETLGGSLASEPHMAVTPAGEINVFYRTPSGGLGHDWSEPGNPVWGVETLGGSLASEPNPVAMPNNVVHVLYRTTSGGLGHDWHEPWNPVWGVQTLGGSLAAKPPAVTTGAATSVSASSAKVEGEVNPERSPTTYYFEYGPTTAYGSKSPPAGQSVGYGTGGIAVSQTLTGLAAAATYHYRIIATGPEGTSNGEDRTFKTESSTTAGQLAGMSVTEPFDGGTESLANFASKWAALGWVSGSPTRGEDTATGWRPVAAYATINGAYYNSTLTDTGAGIAAVAKMATNPGSAERYFSLWLDMQTPASTRAGYELRFTNSATNTYTVKLAKWVSGSESLLATKSGYSFANGSSFAIVDQGGIVSAWTDTGSGFSQLLSAADSAFSGGYAGLHGAGNITRIAKFKMGSL